MTTRKKKAIQKKKAQRTAQRRSAPQQAAGRQHPAANLSRPSRPGHAPAYDQDAGRRPTGAAQSAAKKKRSRSKKEHVRITQAEMRRRRFRRRLLAVILLLLAVTAGILLSVTLLFRVSTFEFQDPSGKATTDIGGYTKEEILQTLEVKQGDNLFSFAANQQEALLNGQFPLLENVEIRRRMPGTVVLRVQPAQESFCIQTSTGWLILSRQCKVMAMSGTQPELPLLIGPVQTVPQVGQTLSLGAPEVPDATQVPAESAPPTAVPQEAPEQTALIQMLAALEQYGILDQVTHLDVTNPEQVYFGYQDRIRVTLGTLNRLDYKLKFAVHLLQNQEGDGLTETDRGVLDMSIIRSDGSIRPTFKQSDPALPSRKAEAANEGDDTASDVPPAGEPGDAPAEGADAAPAEEQTPAPSAEPSAADAAKPE